MPITLTRKTVLPVLAAALLIAVIGYGAYTLYHAITPVRIGVLLPLSGELDENLTEPLEWAKDNINREGGINGRPLELVYRDTGSGNTTQLAREFLNDPSIAIVIGPPTSDDLYAVAPEFIAKKKLLISPEATAGDIVRAFGKKGYIWRTTQGDVAQIKVIFDVLKQKKIQRIALIYENTTYGNTFYQWTGFYATENGIDLSSIQGFEREGADLDSAVTGAVTAKPDIIIAACMPSDAVRIKKDIDASGSGIPLFLTDGGVSPYLVQTLGAAAEGVEATTPTADPGTGFTVAYQAKFGHEPSGYAAPTYDAVLLAAYTAARQESAPFEQLSDSFVFVVRGTGEKKGWDAQEAGETIRSLVSGESPRISGTTGPLLFDNLSGVDPVVSYYAHKAIEAGNFRTRGIISSIKTGADEDALSSLALSRASMSAFVDVNGTPGNATTLIPKKDLWAVIVSTSMDWNNYRHQADALTYYQLLKKNGVSDDHIILMVYDDVPFTSLNPKTGDVHHVPAGENIRKSARVDYNGSEVNPKTFLNVLSGNATPETPVVLGSTDESDVLVYIVDHGSPGAIIFPGGERLSTDTFTAAIQKMADEMKYRKLLVMVDICFGESVWGNATPPGMLYFTGSARTEPSHGAIYDSDIRQWISDDFSSAVYNQLTANPDITISDLYVNSYELVIGSHVRLLNAAQFGSLNIPVKEFFTP
ncbi:MAG: C13 family peptidase [Methanoregulaceae archaeon]